MQRIRVGATGMAAVLLFVVLATAIVSGLKPAAPVPGNNATVISNASDAEPLAQLGAAPGGKADVANKPTTTKR